MHAVILVDDAPLASAVRHALLGAGHRVEIAEGGLAGLLRLAAFRHYDVLVLGKSAGGLDGIEATGALRQRGFRTPVLVVANKLSAAERIRALDAGADDVLTLRSAHLELQARLHALARRATVTGTSAVDSPQPHRQRWQATMLTPRQAQVLELVAEGLTDQQIAKRLRIQPRTARFHVASVLYKLGAGNRAHAAALGASLGLLAASTSP
jgi:DNA-binding NarL/FixJ family response regulator